MMDGLADPKHVPTSGWMRTCAEEDTYHVNTRMWTDSRVVRG